MQYAPRQFLDSDIICCDYETTGLPNDPKAYVFAMSLTWVEDGYTEVWRKDTGEVRFYFDEKETQRSCGDFEQRITDFWASPCGAVVHNLMFEWHFTNYPVHPNKLIYDTMTMSEYIDNLCPSHALDYLFNRYHGKVDWITEADKNIDKCKKIYGTYEKHPVDLMFIYQLADGIRGALLYKLFWPRVSPVSEYWNEIELAKVTVTMIKRGFMVDKKQAAELAGQMTYELQLNAAKTREIVGHYVNLLSEPQLKELLYNELGLPKQPTTDKDDIKKLNHPIVDCIEKARAYTKGVAMVNSYIAASQYDGAIHPSIRTNRAGTGRESSENPNIQNVSKEFKAGVKYTVPARRCFRARPGYILLLADYSGIEMRLAVQGTGDKRLFDLCASGYDFHASCATSFYGEIYTAEQDKDIKSAYRNRAKNARFAMLYGAGLEQTANTLGLTIEQTQVGYEKDKTDFPEFYALMDKCTHDAKKQGHVTTFFGRKLRVPLDRPYAATDYLIQGSAAALFKHAQVKVHKFFKGTDCHKIIPVHDELVMEIPRGTDLLSLTKAVKYHMLDCPEITVSMNVDFSIATYTWDKKNEYKQPAVGV